MNDILQKTYALGQSIWYDSVSRATIRGGELKKLLKAGVRGVTTNPAIFQKALATSTDYDTDIKTLSAAGKSDMEIYDALTLNEVREACTLFRPLWDESRGGDGFVSLEVNPMIADDRDTTVSEALRLWKSLNCPNAMIKIPATTAGISALEETIAAGVNVNATLIFSLEQYTAVAKAYIAAMERRSARGLPLGQASVASVFVSRIDTALDSVLLEKAPVLVGHVAIANARSIYARFAELFSSSRWQVLTDRGARVQRPLWASTGVKNRIYSPTLYADSLIGSDSVNTLPPAALEAFMKHGTPAPTICMPGFSDELERLSALGIDLRRVTERLLADGLASFVRSFRSMMEIIAAKRATLA